MVLSTSASTLTPFAPSFPQSGLSYRSTGCVKPNFFTEAGPNPLISSILIKYSKNFTELILLLSSTISLGPSLFVLAPMARSAVSFVTFWLCIECSTTLKNFGIIVASRFFSAGLYMLFTFLLMGLMSEKQFGQYSYLYALAGYVPFYVTLGINKSFTAFTSNLTNEDEYKNYLGLFWKTKRRFFIAPILKFLVNIIYKTSYL